MKSVYLEWDIIMEARDTLGNLPLTTGMLLFNKLQNIVH